MPNESGSHLVHLVLGAAERGRTMANEQEVPCQWCLLPTTMKATRMCNRCWELNTRIADSPVLARRMLDALGGGLKP